MDISYSETTVETITGGYRITRDATFLEDEMSYERRLLTQDYDAEKYPFYDRGFSEFPEDKPPREAIHTEQEYILLDSNLVPTEIHTIDGDLKLKDGSWYSNGKIIQGHHKNLFIKRISDSLYYYGTILYPLRELLDSEESKRMSPNDMVYGISLIPLMIATPTTNGFTNIRPFNQLGYMIWHLDGIPFQHQTDLPPTESSLNLWLEAMRHFIDSDSPYIRRFFGHHQHIIKENKDIICYTEANNTICRVTTLFEGNYLMTYILNDKVKIMTKIIDNESIEEYIYYIGDVNNPDAIYPEWTGYNSIYIDKNTSASITIYHEIFDINADLDSIRARGGTIPTNEEIINYTVPMWDIFGLLQREDLHAIITMK
jgi:hypothetical protein